MKNNYFKAWQDTALEEDFDSISKLPNFFLKIYYERYSEMKLFKKNINYISGNKLFEIGCATGELYRYLKKKF